MTFTAELASRVNARFANHVDAERAEIYNFAKEVALESFKNGLAAGRKDTKKSATVPGTALKNGRMRPVS